MIIEDDKSLQFLISQYISQSLSDCKVITADNGIDGLQKIQLESPDLVLLDISIPGVNGIEMLDKVRNMFSNKIPVIVLSAISDRSTIFKMRSFDIIDYLVKPVTKYQIMNKIGEALNPA